MTEDILKEEEQTEEFQGFNKMGISLPWLHMDNGSTGWNGEL